MTKKELISKLDEVGSKIEDLQMSLHKIESMIYESIDELKSISKIVEDLPLNSSEIEDDEQAMD